MRESSLTLFIDADANDASKPKAATAAAAGMVEAAVALDATAPAVPAAAVVEDPETGAASEFVVNSMSSFSVDVASWTDASRSKVGA